MSRPPRISFLSITWTAATTAWRSVIEWQIKQNCERSCICIMHKIRITQITLPKACIQSFFLRALMTIQRRSWGRVAPFTFHYCLVGGAWWEFQLTFPCCRQVGGKNNLAVWWFFLRLVCRSTLPSVWPTPAELPWTGRRSAIEVLVESRFTTWKTSPTISRYVVCSVRSWEFINDLLDGWRFCTDDWPLMDDGRLCCLNWTVPSDACVLVVFVFSINPKYPFRWRTPRWQLICLHWMWTWGRMFLLRWEYRSCVI